MRRKLLSSLLAAAMVFTLLPAPAQAASGSTLPDGYTVDSTGTMAYKEGSYSSYDHDFDILGNYKGNWIQTTYYQRGYGVTTAELGGAAVSASAAFINNGQYVQLSYTVTAGDSAVTGGKLAVHADVQIGNNDRAAIEVIQDPSTGKTIGLKMVDDDSNNTSYNAQFNLYFDGTGGVTPVTTYWFGKYSERDDSNSTYGYIYFAPLNDSTKSSSGTYTIDENGVYTKLSNVDSGFAVSWQNINLSANESKTFSFILGVGEKADPPVWGDGDSSPISLTLAADVDADQTQRKIDVSAKVKDASGLTDTLYYSVNGGAGTVLGSVEADGSLKAITGQLDLSSYAPGAYTFSFWVVNSKGAASASVSRTVTINSDGTVSGLDDSGELPPDPVPEQNYKYSKDGVETYAATLLEAFQNADDNSVVTVVRSCADGSVFLYGIDSGDGTTVSPKNLTLELNGKTVSLGGGDGDGGGIIMGGGSLTIQDTVGSGAYGGMLHQQMGTLTVEGGTAGGLLKYGGQYSDEYVYDGTTSLKGGTFKAMNIGDDLLDGRSIIYYDVSAATADEAIAGLKAMLAEGKAFSQTDNQIKTEQIMDEGSPAGYLAYFEGDVSIIDAQPQPHTHSWATAWNCDSAHHWHNCAADGCTVTENSGKDGYGGHVYDNDQDAICNTCGYTRTVAPVEPIVPPVIPTYQVAVEETAHGAALSSHTYATGAATVTLTVTPASGYALESLTVTDHWGKALALTDRGNGTYTFTMPHSPVTVAAVFSPDKCGGGLDCPSRAFLDLDTTRWYHEAVDYVLNAGIMSGYGNGLFGPAHTLSRAMLAQILYNQEGRPAVSGGSAFTDVDGRTWYANAVAWASSNGIVRGYGNGKFGPNDPITREQLAVILWRYAGSPDSSHSLDHFGDIQLSSGYARVALAWANEHGVINGDGAGMLTPKKSATRAEGAQMLKNFFTA